MPIRIGTLVKDMLHQRSRQDAKLDPRGHEKVDNTPIEPPIGFVKQPPLHELIRQMVKSEQLRQAALQQGAETFEEADDFEIGDYEPTSPYEEVFEPSPPPQPVTPAGVTEPPPPAPPQLTGANA